MKYERAEGCLFFHLKSKIMRYKVRFLKPIQTEYTEIEAEDYKDAIQDLHVIGTAGRSYIFIDERNGRHEKIHLALMECEGFEPLVSRYFSSGIWRRGGIKLNELTKEQQLKNIAAELGWTHDPNDLIEPGWEKEEDYS